jgi:hypothetical protein
MNDPNTSHYPTSHYVFQVHLHGPWVTVLISRQPGSGRPTRGRIRNGARSSGLRHRTPLQYIFIAEVSWFIPGGARMYEVSSTVMSSSIYTRGWK